MELSLDDLKQRWNEQDRKLDRGLRLNDRLLRESAIGRAATALRRLSRLLWIEMAFNLLIVIWLGSFMADHVMEPRFLLPAMMLHLGVILLAGSGIRQLVALAALDYGAPVLDLQKRLESLRVERLRAFRWTLLSGPLLWVPLFIVALKGLVGLDLYAVVTREWIAANLLFGAVLIPVAIWVSRRYADRLERPSIAQRLLRDLAGSNLNAAAGFLDSLDSFQREEQA